jgi:hypothetical protein
MMSGSSQAGPVARPPAWLILATGALATALLLMAVTETSLVGHYLIDQGEFISVLGLVFIAGAGVALYRSGRLSASLPFILPWLLYPVITQGDQIIDNLSINWMRLLTHLLLALIFGAPVAVLVVGLRHAAARPRGRAILSSPVLAWMPGLRLMAAGRTREGMAFCAAALIGVEMIAAHVALGTLMIVTLSAMLAAVLLYGSAAERPADAGHRVQNRERRALVLCLAGLALSTALYLGYKHRPGAYQGSPSYLLDPSQQAAGYAFDRIPAGSGPVTAPAPGDAESIRQQLTTYATALDQLVAGYYVVDRNYTWDFHNALFVRSWPLLPDYRNVALGKIAAARRLAAAADAAPLTLPAGDPLGALAADVRAYVAFNFDRAAVLERMTAEFEKTQAGLQHAAHLYEGEGKLVGLGLDELMRKHATVLNAPATAAIIAPFLEISRRVHQSYANRIVGF